MQIEKIPLADAQAFNSFFLDYILQNRQLASFYNRFPSIKNFRAQLDEKAGSYDDGHRQLLTDVFKRQYQNCLASDAVKLNIERIGAKRTFTVTTGHQLNIFTGPLYFIYKLVTVITTCKSLKSRFPDYEFVPVYWMASEDHDFAEINHFKFREKVHTWNSDQTGAVGRFRTDGVLDILNQLPEGASVFREAYLEHQSLSDAVRYYVNALFGAEGLLVFDGDDRVLKSAFRKIMADDIFENLPEKFINETSTHLEKEGYKPQVHPRPINLFYLDNGIRERIEFTNGEFSVVDTSIKFSPEELKQLIKDSPEKFSPNVVLRPLYEEILLPNLAYIGGPSELTYWLQLKGMFDYYKVTFPILLPRSFALILDGTMHQKIGKAGLQVKDLFMPKDALINLFTQKNAEHKIELNGEKEAIEKYFSIIREQAEQVDKSLGPLVGAESHKTIKSLEKIEQKMLKAEKRILAEKAAQVEGLKDRLFPNEGLQERTDNFLNFYLNDPEFIAKLIEHFDPFDFRFNVAIV